MADDKSRVLEETRVKSGQIKQRVDVRSAQRKEEKIKQKEAEIKEHEEFLRKSRDVPMDILASEWLGDSPRSADTRLYLVERVLPTLVVGLESLLQKADEGSDEDFNSINWLAQWLTRNNPRFAKPQTSPYTTSLKSVEIELRTRLLKSG